MWQEEIELPSIRREHVVAAGAAIVASLLAHLFAAWSLSYFEFGLRAFIASAPREEARQLVRLGHVERKVPAVAARPARIRHEQVAVGGSVSAALEALGRAAPAGMMEPPSVSVEKWTEPALVPSVERAAPAAPRWVPRQEVLAIQERVVLDPVHEQTRRIITKIDRVRRAVDVTPDSDLNLAREAASAGSLDAGGGEGHWAGVAKAVGGGAGTAGIDLAATVGDLRSKLLGESPGSISPFQPVEKRLVAKVTAFQPPDEDEFRYFRIDINRVGESALPVIPKDVLLVQDCTASMSEQRLYFCREGLLDALDVLNPEDRFNVVSFRDVAVKCFPEWVGVDRETLLAAQQFVEGMRAAGNTDIFTPLKSLLEESRTPGRPVVAVVISDGKATTGLTASSSIIGGFTRLNAGRVSVFTLGTASSANRYLLDMISYCNRGDTRLVRGGRWDIPSAIRDLVEDVRRPVLSDVGFRFPGDGTHEVYPALPTNLYLDRPMVLYVRCSRLVPRMVFQAVGTAGKVSCDMVFDIDLREIPPTGDSEIRREWARHRVYALVGGRSIDPGAFRMDELRETGRKYGVPVPYEEEL
jgi:hypothetical protein